MNRIIKYLILPANILLFLVAFPQSLEAQEMSGAFIMSSVGGLQNMSNNSMAVTFNSSATCLNVQNGTAVLTGDRGTGNFTINCEVIAVFNSLGIKLYPNPANNQLIIETGSANDKFSFTVYSIDGKLLNEKTISGEKATVDVNNLPVGFYSYQLMNIASLNTNYGKLQIQR